jgi:hypothetical protein
VAARRSVSASPPRRQYQARFSELAEPVNDSAPHGRQQHPRSLDRGAQRRITQTG